ncbi:anthranilate synthase component I family protein [Streptomyces racemochromogenes]|uniref:Anthranilate synthase component I family protein n=1 Tax=Streptomyces racemochromogenes TaxID=67353 RepID=A0ABW7PMS5_9ACTN
MTTLLEPPTPAAAPGPAPIDVHVEETPLPDHEPLDLYTALCERFGSEDVYVLESPAGPLQDRSSAVVGYGRLAEIEVHASHLLIRGCDGLSRALLGVADRMGMPALGPGARGLTRPGLLWEFLGAAQRLFTVHTRVPAAGFAFGFLATVGYGAAWHMEELPERPADTGGPDCVLTLFRDTVHYDLAAHEVRHLRAHAAEFPPPAAYDLTAAALRPPSGDAVPEAPEPRRVSDSTDKETFLARVGRCLRHIGVGDVYQIQIGHSIEVVTDLDPLQVYRRLRARNPSPYMYLVPRSGTTLIGASPEMLYADDGERIVMRPIAGTAPRSGDRETDERRIAALRADEKERAEHTMLVDLCRNDIGRVCREQTLETEGLMTVETYSHVFHLVSTVSGRLDRTHDTWSVLRASFPAGTVTGAPKIRAMELIQDLEDQPRGMYAGAVGLVDLRGWSRFALCIRTVVHDGTTYRTQSCAGIVADSSPEAEWHETLHKMGAAHWALTGKELLP